MRYRYQNKKKADTASRAKEIRNETKKRILELLEDVKRNYKEISDDVNDSFKLTGNCGTVLVDINNKYEKLLRTKWKPTNPETNISELIRYNADMATYIDELNTTFVEFHNHLKEMYNDLDAAAKDLAKELEEAGLDEKIQVRDDTDPDNEENQSKGVGRKLLDKVKRMVGR